MFSEAMFIPALKKKKPVRLNLTGFDSVKPHLRAAISVIARVTALPAALGSPVQASPWQLAG
jgi:hypothetical protein